METVIAALITAAFSAGAAIFVCVWSNRVHMAKTITILEMRLDNLAAQIDRLEVKQDKHNAVIDRVYHLEQENAVQNERLSALSDDVEDLKP